MKRRTLVLVLVLAAALAVGAVAAWMLTRPAGPEATATSYLEALAGRDGEAAAALLAEPIPDTAIAAFDDAAALPIEPAVASVTIDGGTATTTAQFMLGGESRSVTFGLIERDGSWRIAPDALGALGVTTTIGDSVTVGGALVAVGSDVALLPATYEVLAAPGDVLAGSASATVLPGTRADVAVEAAFSSEATALAQEQLDAYAAACAAPASAVPDNCGIRVPWAADLESLQSIVFRIDQMPTVALAADGTTFAATGGVLVATAVGTTREGTAGSFTYRADDWALRGVITVSGETMQLAVS